MSDVDRIHKAIEEFNITKHKIKSNLLSTFSKELFGFPPGKNKPGKPPDLKKLTQILTTFTDV